MTVDAVTRAGEVTGPVPGSGRWAADATDVTYRQVDYWARHGLLGTDQVGLGYGKRRRFEDRHLEIIAAIKHLAALGATVDRLRPAVALIGNARVRPGEWLLVTIAGHALRCAPEDLPRVVHRPGAAHAAWLVPLTAFDNGHAL